MENTYHENGGQKDLLTEDNDEIRQIQMEGYELGVKKARNALFWAGALIFLGEMISMFRMLGEFDGPIFGIAVVEASVFIALAFFTKRKPYTAIILGLIAFILVIILSIVANGYTDGAEGALKALFSGILVKVLIFVALIRPLKEAKELQQMKSLEIRD